MSIEALNWAFKQPVPNSSAKFVLVALANCANADRHGNVVAFPSAEYLCSVTAQNRKTIVSNLAKLREWGLIEDSGDRVGRTGQVIVYRLNCPPDLFTEQTQKRNSSKNGTVPKTDVNSTVFGRKEAQKRYTEPLLTASNLKSGEEKREQRKPRNPEAEREAMQQIAALLHKAGGE